MAFNLRAYFRSQIIARVVIERHVGALAREHITQRRANAAGPAGDERAFTF